MKKKMDNFDNESSIGWEPKRSKAQYYKTAIKTAQ